MKLSNLEQVVANEKDWERQAHCSHQTVGGSGRGRQGTTKAFWSLGIAGHSLLDKLEKVIGVLVRWEPGAAMLWSSAGPHGSSAVFLGGSYRARMKLNTTLRV